MKSWNQRGNLEELAFLKNLLNEWKRVVSSVDSIVKRLVCENSTTDMSFVPASQKQTDGPCEWNGRGPGTLLPLAYSTSRYDNWYCTLLLVMIRLCEQNNDRPPHKTVLGLLVIHLLRYSTGADAFHYAPPVAEHDYRYQVLYIDQGSMD